MSNHAQYATAAVAAVGVLGGAYCAYHAYQASKRARLPERWTQVGTLKELCVYPVKSCQAVPVDKVECTFVGPKKGWLRDRALMVVDEAYFFVTARNYPELYSVLPSVNNAVLTLTSPGYGSVNVPLAEVIASHNPKKAVVWGVDVPVYDCGDEASEWFTRVINRKDKRFRLVYYASQSGRGAPVTPPGTAYNVTNKDTGAFTDDTSFNLINEASVEDLNTRLRDFQVTARYFRPNFLVSGPKAYDEDNWKFVKIGESIFEIVMPCTRCVITTMDPETGVRNPNNEPLKTLRSYRLVEGEKYRKALGTSPRMGVQMALRSGLGGVISLNDAVYVA